MKKEKLILIGGGGHCRSCIDVIEAHGRFEVSAIVDVESQVGQEVLNYSIHYTDESLNELIQKYKNVIITIGQIKNPDLRVSYFEKLKKIGAHFPIIISPRAHVSKYATIKEGSIIMHDSLINAKAEIGLNCIINTKALVEHDAVVGDHCHISTGSIINGGAVIGKKSFIGSQAMVRDNISIQERSIIQAGSSVLKGN